MKHYMQQKLVSMVLLVALLTTIAIPAVSAQETGVPLEDSQPLAIAEQSVTGSTYYVSNEGNDDNDGKSEDQAWASLEKVNSVGWKPGDRILFKAGDVWNGSLKLRGISGTKEAPIIFDKYGSDDPSVRPIINGNGTTTTEKSAIIQNYTGVKDKTLSATIDVVDGSYLQFHNFELTNKNPDVVSQRAGINIRTASTNVTEWEANPHRGIVVKNNYIHDVDGNPTGWKVGSGGILILGNIEDVLVEGNTVERVDIEGIRNAGLYREGDTKANFPRVLRNVVFNNNYVADVQGDGFVMSNVGSNGRMEYNTVVRHSAKNVGNVNYAGLWVIGVKDMVIQYNEVYGGIYGYNDGQAFDVDMFCEGTLYQYNYSHSNRGGFILFMSGSTNSLVRYNISVNDGDGRYIFHYLPTTLGDAPLIHNNTFFTDAQVQTKLISDPGKYLRMYNNIFYSKANTTIGQDRFAGGEVKNNIFYPGSEYKDLKLTGLSLDQNMFASPQFARAGEEPKDIINASQSTFDVEKLNGYKLLPGSPAIDAGMDMTALTPSVWAPATKDFFNNAITSAAKVDIGAHEYSDDAPSEQAPEVMPQTIVIDKPVLELHAKHRGEKMTASVGPDNAWFKGIKWSSSNPAVAAINAQGFVSPLLEGETIITAESTINPNVKAEARVIVHAPSKVVSYLVASDGTELSEEKTTLQLRIDGVTEDQNAIEYADYHQVEYATNNENVVVDSLTGKLEVIGDLAGVTEVEVSAKVQEYKDLVYSESFENGWNDFLPETGTSITTGSISDKIAYHGDQSALFVVGNGSNAIQKVSGGKQQGVVSMMLYDDGSESSKTRVVAHVGNARSSLLAGMGLLYDGGTYGSLEYYSVRASGSSTAWEATPVKRSVGWHELKWDYTSGTDLKMYIDGQLVKTTTAIASFDRIVLGYLWDSANGRTFAFDNIKYSSTGELVSLPTKALTLHVKQPEPKAPAWENAVVTASNVTQTGVTLNWTPAVDAPSITEYAIYKDGVKLASVAGSVYSYQVSGLSADTSYTFKIEAGNAGGKWSEDGPSVIVKTNVDTSSPGGTPGGGTTNPDPVNPDGKDPEKPTTDIVLTDIEGHWASDAIQQAIKLKFINGYTDNSFRPNASVTRGEFAAMLARALHLEEKGDADFADIDMIPAWARPYIASVVNAGIASGFEDNTYRPAQAITRAEVAAMIVRAKKLPLENNAELSFKDADQIPNWAKPFVAAAYKAGLLQGRDGGIFAPADQATRAEAVTLILALLNSK